MKRLGSLLVLFVLVAGIISPASAQPTPGTVERQPAGGSFFASTLPSEPGPAPLLEAAPPPEVDAQHIAQSIVWDKTIDGMPWQPGMEITRQTSDTIVVQETLHLAPLRLAGSPFVPVAVSGGRPTGNIRPNSHSPTPPVLEMPAAPAQPTAAPEDVLWDQPLSTVNQGAYVSQEFPDYPDYSSFLADDFVNPNPWSISTIFAPGDGWNGFSSLFNATALTWQIYADCGGVPCGDPSGGGNPPVWTLTLAPTDAQVVIGNGTPGGLPSNTTLNLASPIMLPAGHWWLVLYPTMGFDAYGQFGRQPADTANGYTGQFINPGGGFGYGAVWQAWTVLGPAQQDLAFRLEGTSGGSVFAQIEAWDPARLRLLDWAATGGNVTINPGQVEWTGEINAPLTMTLTKWFHVEPCTWTETLIEESLWLDGALVVERPVLLHKLPADLWIDSIYDPAVLPGEPASFTLLFGNHGGFENDPWIRNDFPATAPFVASVPPPTDLDPNGRWAEWHFPGLPQGAQGSITVTVAITANASPGDEFEIIDLIFDHVMQVADAVTTTFAYAGCLEPSGVDFSWAPISPTLGQSTHFTGTVGGGATPLYYSWDFGDGSGSTGSANVGYWYSTAGTFIVTLMVTNSCGMDDAEHEIVVQPAAGTVKLFLPIIYNP